MSLPRRRWGYNVSNSRMAEGDKPAATPASITTPAGPKLSPSEVRKPTWEVFELKFQLMLAKAAGGKHTQDSPQGRELLQLVKAEGMAGFYEELCDDLGWSADRVLLEEMRKKNEETIEKLEAAVAEAVKQYGDVEKRDAVLCKANHYAGTHDFEKALKEYRLTMDEKAMEPNGKLQILMNIARIGLLTGDKKLAGETLTTLGEGVEKTGDWETRNRLKIYKSVHLIRNLRDFKEASDLLADTLSTFNATELISLNHIVTLTVITAMISQPRYVLKSKLNKSPEVLQAFADLPQLEAFFNSFMNCDYKAFFASYTAAMQLVKSNRWLAPHYLYVVRSLRLIAYRQYLQPYCSVSVPAMAAAFGVSPKFMEDQIISFIPSGDLAAQIDKITQTIICRPNKENDQVTENFVKVSDAFVNNLQILSRVIDM